MYEFVSARRLANMAGVSVATIHRLVNKGVLKPYINKRVYLFEFDYAKRIAPIIAVRNSLAISIGTRGT